MSARVANFVFAYRAGAGEPAVIEATPASAFSRGDILVVGANASQISGGQIVANALSGTPDILGVALTDSNESINGLCPFLIPGPEDVFLSRVSGGSLTTRGDEIDIFTDGAGRFYAGAGSANTARLVTVKGQNEVLGQSDDSRVLVKFLYHAGNVDLS